MATLTHGRFDTATKAGPRRAARPGLVQRIAATFQTWRRRIDERQALAAFGWRDMHDIGITHADVMREIVKPFWKA